MAAYRLAELDTGRSRWRAATDGKDAGSLLCGVVGDIRRAARPQQFSRHSAQRSFTITGLSATIAIAQQPQARWAPDIRMSDKAAHTAA